MPAFLSLTCCCNRLARYDDVNDPERLSQGPTLRVIGSEKLWDRGAALTSRLQTFAAELLAEGGNFVGPARLNRELIGKAEEFGSMYRVLLDLVSTEIPLLRLEKGSAEFAPHYVRGGSIARLVNRGARKC